MLYVRLQKEVSLSRQGQERFSGSTCRFSVALITKKHKYFPGIREAAGDKAATPPIPGLCFQKNSMFLYSLLKSSANAVLKLMSAMIAIAHVLFVSIKSLSVIIMQLEYSFGKLKYDSITHPMSGFLGSLHIFAFRSPVSNDILNFFINNFLVWISPTPTPRTKISIEVPVDRIMYIKSRLDAGISNALPGQPRKDHPFCFLCISYSLSLRSETRHWSSLGPKSVRPAIPRHAGWSIFVRKIAAADRQIFPRI